MVLAVNGSWAHESPYRLRFVVRWLDTDAGPPTLGLAPAKLVERSMAEDLRDVARRFREGSLVESGESGHALVSSEPGYRPAQGEFLAGPSRIISVRRRQDGRWDVEFVPLVEAAPVGR